MDFGKIDYSSNIVPDNYKCTTCGIHGCKLWREYQVFADMTELVCCDCAGKSQKEDVSQIDDAGLRPLNPEIYGSNQRTDNIGWRIPAVPTTDGSTFWGYTSVPDDGVLWWKKLPTRVVRTGQDSPDIVEFLSNLGK